MQNNANPFFCVLQTSSDFDAKPMVMLLGQYSTGKTTFIKHLLRTSYPGFYIYQMYLLLFSRFVQVTCCLKVCGLHLQVPISDQSQQQTDL